MVNKALQSYLNKFAIIYMDDILVYSNTQNKHVKNVKLGLNALEHKNLNIKTKNANSTYKK